MYVHVCVCVCALMTALCVPHTYVYQLLQRLVHHRTKHPPGPGTTLAQRAKEQETRYSSQVQHRPTAANYNILPDSVLYDYMFFLDKSYHNTLAFQ